MTTRVWALATALRAKDVQHRHHEQDQDGKGLAQSALSATAALA